MADSFANRRARELYVGGLVAGCADRQNIKEFFAGLLGQLPEFKQKYAFLFLKFFLKNSTKLNVFNVSYYFHIN